MSAAESATSSGRAIIDRHDRYMIRNIARFPVAMVRGKGALLWDADGKEYLDLFAGFGGPLLGHCHPELIEAVAEQAQKLWAVGNLMHTEPQTLAAQAIAERGFNGKSYFCHGGADANEAAIKLARLHGQAKPGEQGPRFKVISAEQSFHGRTFGAMAATGQPRVYERFEPLPGGFVHVPYNDLSAIENAIDEQTTAVLIEPIQGESGVHVPNADYWPGLRQLCDHHDLLLIADEVWTGCGRTGRWFAHQHWNIEPDVMTLGKGVGGGMAVGVMCTKPEVAELLDPARQGGVMHATTLSGHCLAMAATARLFEVIARDGLVERAEQVGKQILERLQQMVEDVPMVRQVRGRGLFVGIELDLAKATTPVENARQLVERCMDQGVLLNAGGGDTLRLAPPLNIDEGELDRGLSIMENVLKA